MNEQDTALRIAHMLRTNEAYEIDMQRGSQFDVFARYDHKSNVFLGFKLVVRRGFNDITSIEMGNIEPVFSMFDCYLRQAQQNRKFWSFAMFDHDAPEAEDKEYTFWKGSGEGRIPEGLEAYEKDTTDWAKPRGKRRATGRKTHRRHDDVD